MLVQEPLGGYEVFSRSFESSRDRNSTASSDPNPVPPHPVLLVDARDASHLVACSFQWSIPPVVQGGSGESARSSHKAAPVQPASSASENTPKPRVSLRPRIRSAGLTWLSRCNCLLQENSRHNTHCPCVGNPGHTRARTPSPSAGNGRLVESRRSFVTVLVDMRIVHVRFHDICIMIVCQVDPPTFLMLYSIQCWRSA